jgi:cobalamin biosynthetic protein CobC
VKDEPGSCSRRVAIERLFEHGGDINSAIAAFPNAPRPWIDLSTGLNPVAYPLPELSPEVWTRLPAPAALEALHVVAARAYGAAPECVAAAAGTQAILQILPHLFSARRVSILGPTYEEHARTWKGAGAEIEIVSDLDDATAEQIIVANPNNPDGRIFSRLQMSAFARRCASEGRRLIVDEAFMDFEVQSVSGEQLPATIVLRSFGKAYGLAGLRLGFAIAPPPIAAELRAALGPWPVSGPAIAIGKQALADADWLAVARRRLDSDAAWLDEALSRAGYEIVGGAPLFRLARRLDAAEAFVGLCSRGILTRPFRRDSTLLRFAIPTEEQRARIADALRST